MTSGLHRLLRSACSKQSTQSFTPADKEKNIGRYVMNGYILCPIQ